MTILNGVSVASYIVLMYIVMYQRIENGHADMILVVLWLFLTPFCMFRALDITKKYKNK